MNREELGLVTKAQLWIVALRHIASSGVNESLLEKSINVGENPLLHLQPYVHGV